MGGKEKEYEVRSKETWKGRRRAPLFPFPSRLVYTRTTQILRCHTPPAPPPVQTRLTASCVVAYDFVREHGKTQSRQLRPCCLLRRTPPSVPLGHLLFARRGLDWVVPVVLGNETKIDYVMCGVRSTENGVRTQHGGARLSYQQDDNRGAVGRGGETSARKCKD